ncbi:head decoration protein [Terrarubrum flagellatum]|uniref:head decoration protein n=1 Tax=Terrirubrum flagellatum TaxID=2895980 RepID=UPI0031450143
MTNVLHEPRHPGSAILSESNGARSRDVITIASGSGKLEPNTVVGKIAVGSATAAAKAGGNTGNGAISAISVLQGAMTGVYTARCITAAANGGVFRVENPKGDVIGDVAVGAAFSDDIGFTISDSSADFVVGDGFDITVAAGSGKYKPSPMTGADGSEQALAVIIYGVDATSADVKTVAITDDATMIMDELVFHASVDDAAKRQAKFDQLRANSGIKVR